MFFKDNIISNIIPSMDYNELKRFAKERSIPYDDGDEASKWNVYAQKYGSEHGLTYSEQLSFGYIISSIIGGMGYSCSTEVYYKEEQIFHESINALNQLNDSGLSESEVIKELFDYIFILYHEKIEDYCFKTEKINIKISLSMLERMDCVEGENRSEKFRTLMNYYFNRE